MKSMMNLYIFHVYISWKRYDHFNTLYSWERTFPKSTFKSKIVLVSLSGNMLMEVCCLKFKHCKSHNFVFSLSNNMQYHQWPTVCTVATSLKHNVQHSIASDMCDLMIKCLRELVSVSYVPHKYKVSLVFPPRPLKIYGSITYSFTHIKAHSKLFLKLLISPFVSHQNLCEGWMEPAGSLIWGEWMCLSVREWKTMSLHLHVKTYCT